MPFDTPDNWKTISMLVSGAVAIWGFVDFVLDEIELRRTPPPDPPKVRKRFGGLIVGVLGIIALLITLRIDSLSEADERALKSAVRRAESANTAAQKQLDSTRRSITELQAHQTTAATALEAQRIRAVSAEAKLRQIEKSTATRQLTPRQSSIVVSRLKPGGSADVAVTYQTDDSEAAMFAGQLCETLKEAGWGCALVGMVGHTEHRGVFINVGTRELPFSAPAVTLHKALRSVGVKSTIGYLPNVLPNAIELFVAGKE